MVVVMVGQPSGCHLSWVNLACIILMRVTGLMPTRLCLETILHDRAFDVQFFWVMTRFHSSF